MTRQLVTIATFHTEIEMIRIKGMLENEDVKCFVKDEYVTQMRESSYAGNSGIKLQIFSSDLPKATQILKENGYLSQEDLNDNFLEKKLKELTQKYPFLYKFLHLRFGFTLLLITLVLLLLLSKYLSGN
jgi:hypothetical protein